MPADDLIPNAKPDRCDRCNALGIVKIRKIVAVGDVLVMWMCKHHYEHHELVLMAAGWKVAIDNRSALVVKP